LFRADALIVKRTGDSLEIMSVDTFLEPRKILLGSGALTEFSEWETDSRTVITGGLACRWSTYEKSGFMHEMPYNGAGRKIFTFVHTAAGWRIISAVWEDED